MAIKSLYAFALPLGLVLWLSRLVPLVQAQATDWPMTAANPQRTSQNAVEVRGNLSVEWFHNLDPYIDHKVQVIAAGGKVFVATSKGLYAYDASSGAQAWVYGTEMPLGNSPTYANGILYVGGFDRRVHAVNASDGKLKSGWSFVIAGAGYETNPIVANGKVYIANRDGHIYALDATDGHLIWKWRDASDPWADAPIRFSPAFKDSVLYVGSDNAHAYALRDNGSSASLVWKSAKLPGTGFSTYWPVIYTSGNKDYVIFSGSKKADWLWFDGVTKGSSMYYWENYDLSSGICNGTDCSPLTNYFKNNPTKRHFFALDAATGSEVNNPYPPVNWAGATHGGNKFPPIVTNNGGLYTFVGYNSGGNNGAHGWLARITLGSSSITKLNTSLDGAADEPESFTSGGNVIHWAEGVNAIGFGSIDSTTGSTWRWNPNVAGVGTKYSGLDDSGNNIGRKFGADVGNGRTGPYSFFDGLLNFSPIPYNDKLYLIYANTLVALSPSGGNRNLGLSAAPSIQTPPPPLEITEIQQRLQQQVQKVLEAGHLRPGFMDSGILGGAYYGIYNAPSSFNHFIVGNLGQYFRNPSETVITLAMALPYLSAAQQTQVKTYLNTHYAPGKSYDFTRYVSVGWKGGAKREIYDDTPDLTTAINNGNDFIGRGQMTSNQPGCCINGNLLIADFSPISFYAGWKFAQAMNYTPAQAKALLDGYKSKLPTAGTGNAMNNTNLLNYPYVLNEYIAGYRGYLELEKLAGYTTSISASSKYGEYTRLLNLRVSNFNQDVPWQLTFNYNNGFGVSRNFMHLVPELAEELRTSKLSQVQKAVTDYQALESYWFVSKYDRTYGEGTFHPLYDIPALFQAKALILKQPFSELAKYLDVPAFAVGDLYYLQNLTYALEAAQRGGSPLPTPTASCLEDLNADRAIDMTDLLQLMSNWGRPGPADLNQNGTVDISDLLMMLGKWGNHC